VGLERLPELLAPTQVPDRSEVDALIAGVRDGRENRVRRRHARLADRALECPIAHGGVCDPNDALRVHGQAADRC
jgi:hypothetical protein